MRLLLFSDVHCDVVKCRNLVTMANDVDLVIGAGDFANQRVGLGTSINVLKNITKPTIVVPGNHESYSELVTGCHAWDSVTILHGTSTEFEGQTFFGVGGGVPAMEFGEDEEGWSYDFTEEQADDLYHFLPKKAILISHSPPYGAADRGERKRLGSKMIRQTIIDKKPKLVICGHIHESWGVTADLEGVKVINAGPDGVIIEI